MAPAVKRIHIEVPEELHTKLKAAAAAARMTLKEAVTEAVEKWVQDKQ